jgi:microcystin-dependent protein
MFINPYIATVTVFGGNYAPVGWMFCQGQVLSTSAYASLFSLIGTTYGGNGITTFALPDLRSRRAIHLGQGTDLPLYSIGQTVGAEKVTLQLENLPVHTHTNPVLAGTPQGSTDVTGTNTASANVVPAGGATVYGAPEGLSMGVYSGVATTVSIGGNKPIPTIAPYQAMNYIIAVEGTFPSRN